MTHEQAITQAEHPIPRPYNATEPTNPVFIAYRKALATTNRRGTARADFATRETNPDI